MYIFIGRYQTTLWVDLIAFIDKETAYKHYQKMLSEKNELGYNEIELLERTSYNFYKIIEKN